MTSRWPVWLAAAMDPVDIHGSHADHTLGAQVHQILLVAGVLLGLGALLFLAVYLAKGKRRHGPLPQGNAHGRRRHRHGHHPPHRHRRRRQEHRPRNPTLAETGGLPPLRPEDPPKSPS